MKLFTLDMSSKGLKNNELMTLVSLNLTKLRERNFRLESEEVSVLNTDLFIDGEKWMFVTNSKLNWISISKL